MLDDEGFDYGPLRDKLCHPELFKEWAEFISYPHLCSIEQMIRRLKKAALPPGNKHRRPMPRGAVRAMYELALQRRNAADHVMKILSAPNGPLDREDALPEEDPE